MDVVVGCQINHGRSTRKHEVLVRSRLIAHPTDKKLLNYASFAFALLAPTLYLYLH
jgi:hypothetical protein